MRAVRLRALGDAPDAFWTTLAEDQARAPETWRAGLERASGATFVATLQGADVGLAVGAEYRGRERTAGLFGMWVAPEARRCGVASPLVEAVKAWARSAGYERIVLQVGDENAGARRLYARMGFVATGATGTFPAPRTHIREHEMALEL